MYFTCVIISFKIDFIKLHVSFIFLIFLGVFSLTTSDNAPIFIPHKILSKNYEKVLKINVLYDKIVIKKNSLCLFS